MTLAYIGYVYSPETMLTDSHKESYYVKRKQPTVVKLIVKRGLKHSFIIAVLNTLPMLVCVLVSLSAVISLVTPPSLGLYASSLTLLDSKS